eukprot:scaffold13915_cov16-Tisochrysis_lutea.AAC.1
MAFLVVVVSVTGIYRQPPGSIAEATTLEWVLPAVFSLGLSAFLPLFCQQLVAMLLAQITMQARMPDTLCNTESKRKSEGAAK